MCRRCTDRLSGKEYAVKIVSKRVDCATEIRLLKQCQGHPNVVQLIDVLQVLLLKFLIYLLRHTVSIRELYCYKYVRKISLVDCATEICLLG